MSGDDGSCARTRGLQWVFRKVQKKSDSKSSSSDEDMSFNFDDSDKSEPSSDASVPFEKEFSGLGKDLSGLKVSSFKQAMEAQSSRDAVDDDEDLAMETVKQNDARYGNRSGIPPDNVAKERSGKHKGGHRKRDNDDEKRSKRKEKSKDKQTSKDSKRKKEEADDKRSHDRGSKSEKSHKGERDEESDFYRKDKHRSSHFEREQFRGSRHEIVDDYGDHRRDRHWSSSRSNHHKGSSKFEREKDSKRARLDNDQRTSNRGRSPSPRANKWVRSPSPHQAEVEEKDWAAGDRSEKDGNTRFRRSGLGGYSPRRRRSDAAIRTPSPPARSPERKKTRAWDLPPVGMDSGVAAAMAAAHQAAAQQVAALASVSTLVTVNPALAAVSLTQATRNFRRLYIGNVPTTVSDSELLEFINAAMLTAHANSIPGTKPCINCMVNVEKSYAFAEFLTPEDATAGLAFDGITLHGITLKIRRPRDYIPPLTGVLGIGSAIGMVSNVVPDSPQKIFVGGICRTLSSEKVKEIVTAFGQLKAYHWEVTLKKNQIEAFAFLEYLDPAVTIKACAGLNGMRLGNKVLTVVQATPNAIADADGKETPFYGIPEHAKTLLQPPTRILELQNVITKAEALSLSDVEISEIELDVRTECARFGTVKSTHVVKLEGRPDSSTQPDETDASDAFITEVDKKIAAYIASVGSQFFQAGEDPAGLTEGGASHASALTCPTDESGGVLTPMTPVVSEPEGTSFGVQHVDSEEQNGEKDPTSQLATESKELATESKEPSITELKEPSVTESKELSMALATELKEPGISSEEGIMESGEQGSLTDKTESENGIPNLPPNSDPEDVGLDAGNLSSEVGDSDLGRVYVEFTREDCACLAAHALHGRLYGDREVIVGYFPLKLYQKRFKKGLEPRTHEERQALALAAQELLNSYIPDY